MTVIKTVTHLMHKGGKFTFSCECDHESLALIDGAVAQYYHARRIPIHPDQAVLLERTTTRRSIFGTAAIEGNPLTEDEVDIILQEKQIVGKQEALLEIQNLKNAYAEFNHPSDKPFFVSEELIKAIHRVLTTGINYYHNSPGNYRNEIVKVGDINHGGVYTPPRTLDDIKALMKLFVKWINSKEMLEANVFIRAAAAHYYLAKIHPFQDGNGRTSRLLETIILTNGGINIVSAMLSDFYYRNIDDYFVAFSKARKENSFAPFLRFVGNGFISSLNEYENTVIDMVGRQLIKVYISDCLIQKKIFQRQYDLLMALLDIERGFSLPSLYLDSVLKHIYASVSESTARRDIKKLLQLNLIVKEGDLYVLNLSVLN